MLDSYHEKVEGTEDKVNGHVQDTDEVMVMTSENDEEK